jgi:hypothetical protein
VACMDAAADEGACVEAARTSFEAAIDASLADCCQKHHDICAAAADAPPPCAEAPEACSGVPAAK